MMASSMAGDSDLPEPRERSKSCSDEQRPQPKPRKKFQSVRYTGSRVRSGTSISADSSPRETRSCSILQPTPLIQAITNQLMSKLNSEEKMQQSEANSDTQKMDSVHHIEGTVNFFESVGSKNKLSPIVQSNRAHSEPRNAPPRPPPPANPSPRLNRLITDYRATSSAPIHVIDSRSKAIPSPTSPKKTTKYGTPPPSRPAPPPPARCIGKEKERGKGSRSPKSQNSPVPKPRMLLSRQGNAGSQDQDSPPSTIKASAEDDIVTNKPVVDQSFPVYEDLDKDDNNYETLDPSFSSDDDNEPTFTNFNRLSDALPPPLPPKKGAKKEEELPPLPPRALPATTVRKHRFLASHTGVPDESDKRKDSEEEENEDALQDTGVYEPVIYRDSDDESRKSEESYTEMTNPNDVTDSDLENDHPEEVYITMDPHSYIPPPQTYKPKKKTLRAIFKGKQH